MAGSAGLVEKAHKFRKVWGGGWRQAGILAAAGLYALEHNIKRLQEDHTKAQEFARLLDECEGIEVIGVPETNIVIFSVNGWDRGEFSSDLSTNGVFILAEIKR